MTTNTRKKIRGWSSIYLCSSFSPSIVCQLLSTFITSSARRSSRLDGFFFKAAPIALLRREHSTTVDNGWSLSSLTSRSWGQPVRLRFPPILLSYLMLRVCIECALLLWSVKDGSNFSRITMIINVSFPEFFARQRFTNCKSPFSNLKSTSIIIFERFKF